MIKKVVAAVILVGIVVTGALWVGNKPKTPTTNTTTKQTTQKTTTTQTQGDGFNKQQYSLTDPNSIWVIVNKTHHLNPVSYTPSDLVTPSVPLRVPGNQTMEVRQVTATALKTMFAAAKAQNLQLMLASGFRSYSYQVSLYNGYVQSQGQAVADTQSARPGYSEHQSGLAADIEPVSRNCELDQCFGTTPEGEWLATNAYKYGFIIRYPQGLENITGYEYEPWHVRYVGVDLATEMHKDNILTFEQFFGVSGGETYQ